MLLVTSTPEADARKKTIDVQGQSYVLRGYIGAAPVRGTYVEGNEVNDNELPQGFHVTQPPGAVTRPHFHEFDQFQVFVSGSARLGKKAADPITVQFAGAHTPYGPIVAGDEGVEYFTLRKRWDPGAKYMPQMREHLVRGRQRQSVVSDVTVSHEQALASRTDATVDTLIGPEDDGLLAAVLRLGPGGRAKTPDASDGDGQYHVVVNGSLAHQDAELPRWSCQFAFPDEGAVPVTAGPTGVELLVLRFPKAGPMTARTDSKP